MNIPLMNIVPDQFAPFPKVGHHIQQSVMPLLVISGQALIALGTGFMITEDGLLMTAAHVAQEAVKYGVRSRRQDGGFDYELSLYALYITNQKDDNSGQHVGGVLPIHKFWHSPELDIAFCRLGSANDQNVSMPKFPVFRLSPSLPAIGEKICGCGYYQMQGSVGSLTKEGKIEVRYSQNTAYTPGTIIEVHPVRRDSAMLRFPCFQTDARFDAGMSGGPVVNQHGNVCGVICSSLPADELNPEHASYASLIWPAFGTPLEIEQPGQKTIMTMLYDLAKDGKVEVDATFDFMQVTMLPDGSRTIGISGQWVLPSAE